MKSSVVGMQDNPCEVVDVEGFVSYRNNRYSVPWDCIGQLFPMRITEDQVLIYNRHVTLIATHPLLDLSQSGKDQVDPSHRAPRNQQIQLDLLQQRFAEFGEHGMQFLAGLLGKQRYGKHQAGRVLVLFQSYTRESVLSSLERAIRFHAFSYSSLERILCTLGTPRPPWQSCTQEQEKFFEQLDDAASIGPRPSSDYQHLLFDEESADDEKKDLRDAKDDTTEDGTVKSDDHPADDGQRENPQWEDNEEQE